MKKTYLILLAFALICPHIYSQKLEIIKMKKEFERKPDTYYCLDKFNGIKTIYLDTPKDAKFSTIWKVIFNEKNHLYIKQNNKCSIFDLAGHHIKTIDKVSDEDSTSVFCSDFFYHNDELYIFERTPQKLHVYNTTGVYNRTIQLSGNCHEVAITPENEFIGYIPNISGTASTRFLWFDSIGNIIDSSPQPHYIDNINIYMVLDKEGNFFSMDDKIYFKEMLNDTIYSIEKHRVIPQYVLNIGKRNAQPEARVEIKSVNDDFDKDMARIVEVWGNETDLYITDIQKGLFIYDRKKKRGRKIKLHLVGYSLRLGGISTNQNFLIGVRRASEDDKNPVLTLLYDKK